MHLPIKAVPRTLLYPNELSLSSNAKVPHKTLWSFAQKVSNIPVYCDAVTQVHLFCPSKTVDRAVRTLAAGLGDMNGLDCLPLAVVAAPEAL